ncbi:lysine 5,6-aminomutase reactivase subunit KamB [Alicyclobacillus mengziensis]|uniref:Uncharacterized protein n=1 Tax=Alicyclobacillus mengziensis TaxID=2931921 RepID=A0A9X7Z7T3_9BACL|nr:hypothetical protein [Alicyclobacillus mengziensis]QSO47641.1 hypothetical protein JZ786_00835 [Alicyclobacillus mengziensis]
MDLLLRCRQNNWRKLAFIGIAKHAGKTTALNAFLHQLSDAEESVGLLSIGVDGERLDAILGVPKPRVFAEYGTYVASAERALLDSGALFEWIAELPISSPLGPVMVVRVTTPGTVVLAGIRQRAHVQMAVDALRHLGCHFVLVDGAFDRVAAATPTLVDAAVLAVGAVVGNTVQEVADNAQPVIARFGLQETGPEWKALFAQARRNRQAALAVEREDAPGHLDVLYVPAHAVMFDVTRQMGWSDDVVAVYIPGAVTDGTVDSLLRHPRDIQIVADHPAQVLLSGRAHRRLMRHGHGLSVWDRLPLAAIAANPHHIAGVDLPRVELLSAVAEVAGDVPVFDALHMAETTSDALEANRTALQGGEG